MFRTLVFLFLLVGCATQQETSVWFESERPIPKGEALVLITETFPVNCPVESIGCYQPENVRSAVPGIIYLRPRMHPWQHACVLAHEQKHHGKPATSTSAGVKPLDHPVGFEECPE